MRGSHLDETKHMSTCQELAEYRNILCVLPAGRAMIFVLKRCPRGEQICRGDLVKKETAPRCSPIIRILDTPTSIVVSGYEKRVFSFSCILSLQFMKRL